MLKITYCGECSVTLKNEFYLLNIMIAEKKAGLINLFPLDENLYQRGAMCSTKEGCRLYVPQNPSLEEMERIVRSKDVFQKTLDEVFDHPAVKALLDGYVYESPKQFAEDFKEYVELEK